MNVLSEKVSAELVEVSTVSIIITTTQAHLNI